MCTVCRKLSVGSLGNRQCVETCPDDLFVYEQRRCVTKEECWNIPKPFTSAHVLTLQNPYIPHDGRCHWTCPKYHTAEGPSGRRFCKSCNGECKRECHGGTIDSLAAAQSYRGCVIITGTLIIKIRLGGRKLHRDEPDRSSQSFLNSPQHTTLLLSVVEGEYADYLVSMFQKM